MLPSRSATTVLAAAALLVACDVDGDITIHPEVDQVWDFDAGLGQWSPASADAAGAWSVAGTTEAASRGAGSARFVFEGVAPPAKVWIQRSFELDTLRTYEVTIEYDLGGTEAATDTAWSVVAGAGGSLTAAQLAVQGPTVGDAGGGVSWVHRKHVLHATSGPEGTMWLGVGLAPGSTDDRTYYLDDLSVTFFRQ